MSFIGVLRSDLDTLPGETSDEMYMEEEKVVFNIYTKGYFEYDPLRCKRKISKSKKTGVIHDEGASRKRKKSLVSGGYKGKEKVFEDEGADKKQKKTLVNGGSKGKEKVFEDEGNQGVVTIYKRANDGVL
ncbi:hypothetical protein Tco_0128930 [Tanacetum coccineum]